jgi:hypothetical protein
LKICRAFKELYQRIKFGLKEVGSTAGGWSVCWSGNTGGLGLSEVIEAEAIGLSEVVEFLSKFQHDKVIIELDNQSIVKAVNSRNFPRNYWGQIARCGEDFLLKNPNCTIRWIRRNGNEAAHF